jgi:hypothetical protein
VEILLFFIRRLKKIKTKKKNYSEERRSPLNYSKEYRECPMKEKHESRSRHHTRLRIILKNIATALSKCMMERNILRDRFIYILD